MVLDAVGAHTLKMFSLEIHYSKTFEFSDSKYSGVCHVFWEINTVKSGTSF